MSKSRRGNQLVVCEMCGGSGWVKPPSSGRHHSSSGRRGQSGPVTRQMFESSVATLPFNPGQFAPTEQRFDPIDQAPLSPGEERHSTLYHQWSTGDVWVSALIAGMSGVLVGVPGTIICIAAQTEWYWPLLTWTVPPVIMWGFKVVDFFTDDKAIVQHHDQERVAEAPAIIQEAPSAEIVINDGHKQTRAKLQAPRTNYAGLWQYADALVRDVAAPSYEGGKEVLGAKAFGYTPVEFDKWRPAAITGGILEEDPHKSKGYRLTSAGRRALARVAEHRLGEWG